MRKATNRIGSAFGMVALVAAAGLVGPAISSAEPTDAPAPAPAPTGAPGAGGHQVRYTVTTNAPYEFELFYLTTQPADKAAFNADAYAFAKREKVTLSPGQPWTFETTLADPQWAILTVSSTTRGTSGPPGAHCDIAVDGQLAVAQDDPYNLQCRMPNSVI